MLKAGLAALDVDMAAAEEHVDGQADAVEEAVGRVVGFRPDAVELALDEEGTLLVEGARIVELALLLRTTRDFRAELAEVKPG